MGKFKADVAAKLVSTPAVGRGGARAEWRIEDGNHALIAGECGKVGWRRRVQPFRDLRSAAGSGLTSAGSQAAAG